VGERVVVIGGDAAGMSAASQGSRVARGNDRDLDIVVLERGHWTSYSACGIPYWVAGYVDDADRLVARTPEQHRANGLDVRMRAEAVGVDLDARTVDVRHADTGERGRIGFDQLVVATGASPVRPDLPGVDARGVHGVQTLDDGAALIEALEREKPEHAVVVGGGYIGIEMAEAFVGRGLEVTLVDQAAEPMSTLDPDMGRLVRESMESMGIRVVTGTPVEGFESGADGRVTAVSAGTGTY
jgi:NADPH-dependent 2,4-dienoyl-CoA reductase/sulfur reductase-like enzyme